MSIELDYPGGDGESTVICDLRHLDGDTYDSTSGSRSRGIAETFGAALGVSGYFNLGSAAGAPAGSRTIIADELGLGERMIAGAGAPGLIADFSTMWLMPTYTQWAFMPVGYTLRRRFTLSWLVNMKAASTASIYAVGFKNQSANLDGAGVSGIELAYDPSLSATWRLRNKPTTGAAITTVVDTGLAVLGAAVFVEFVFIEGPAAQLSVRVNSQTIATLTGASIPVPATPFPLTTNIGMGAWQGGGKGIGASNDGDMRVRRARYLVERLVA